MLHVSGICIFLNATDSLRQALPTRLKAPVYTPGWQWLGSWRPFSNKSSCFRSGGGYHQTLNLKGMSTSKADQALQFLPLQLRLHYV